MAHLLEITNKGAAMAYRETEGMPWHGLGVPLKQDVNVDEMLDAAQLNWTIDMVPAISEYKGQVLETGHFSLVRSSDQRVLDCVPEGWLPIQNRDAFSFFDKLVEQGDAFLDTAGSLRDGQVVWGLAKLKDAADITVGDPTECYLLLTNNHRYGWSISVCMTPIRVVCNNTLTIALNGAFERAIAKFNHNHAFDAELAQIALASVSDRFAAYTEQARFLAKCRAPEDQVQEFLKKIFPALGEAGKKGAPSLPAIKAFESLEEQPGANLAAGTWWNAYNAVTFTCDHVLGQTRETSLHSTWYGENAKRKRSAFDLALKYAKEDA